MVSGFFFTRKRFIIALTCILGLPFTLFILQRDEVGVRLEEALTQEIAQLRQRVAHVEMVNSERRRDLVLLTQHVNRSVPWSNRTSDDESGAELSRLLLNPARSLSLRLTTIYSFLSYLLNDPLSTVPSFVDGQGRMDVSLVLGVPTVKREAQSYLLSTLASLIDGLSPEDRNRTLIIVFVAETDAAYVASVAEKIKKLFGQPMQSGLLEIVAPPASFYPDMARLRTTLNDPPERVRWRTKQNLDYAFLMMYAQSRGTYYVQLEDDILTAPGYASKMLRFALDKEARKDEWFLLDFCQLGFIGKMFRSVDLPYLIQFSVMFANDKPVDWLLGPLLETRFCPHDAKKCTAIKAKKWVHYKPSLFQHVGTTSSLRGKIQNLKDKQFGKVALFTPHRNPAATIASPIKAYKTNTIERAYRGEGFFWGLMPQAGDTIEFHFEQPQRLQGYRVRSGNLEHPSDLLYDTLVEVLPAPQGPNGAAAAGRYVTVGRFDELGVAEAKLRPDELGPLASVRLNIQGSSKNWVIISEIMFDVADR